MEQQKNKIKILNDQFRKGILSDGFNGNNKNEYLTTPGIRAFSPWDQLNIFREIQCFEDFTPENDPHNTHASGSLTYESQRVFWKIDYYSPDLSQGSEDPADAEKTHRVLTVMLPMEY